MLHLVEAGYPVDEALATATSVPARTLGLGDTIGRLRPGLLVVGGDLRRDPDALGRPQAVLVRGVAPPPALPDAG